MGLALSEDQRMLASAARDLVAAEAPIDQLRALRDRRDADGFSRGFWKQMAELGWVGAAIPEAFGGAGLGHAELGLVLEALGRNLVASPLLASSVLGANALLLGADEETCEALVPPLARGEHLMALAFEETSRFAPYHVESRASRPGSFWNVQGEKTFVLDGHVAQSLVVSVRTSGAIDDRDGLTLLHIPTDSPGVEIRRTTMVDSRNAARVILRDVSVPAEATLGRAGSGADLLDALLDRGAAALAAEMLGTAEAAFELTLDYLKVREQFGVPIGSFQALKHRAAEMYVALELSRSLVRDALLAIDEGREDVSLCASAAKAHVSETLELVASEAIQMHGGIGMTDEQDVGLYFKRARAAAFSLGGAAHHRDRIASMDGF